MDTTFRVVTWHPTWMSSDDIVSETEARRLARRWSRRHDGIVTVFAHNPFSDVHVRWEDWRNGKGGDM